MRAYSVCIVVRVPVYYVYITSIHPPTYVYTCTHLVRVVRYGPLAYLSGGGTLRYLLSPMTFDSTCLIAILSNVI